jgi:hypothetical protein
MRPWHATAAEIPAGADFKPKSSAATGYLYQLSNQSLLRFESEVNVVSPAVVDGHAGFPPAEILLPGVLFFKLFGKLLS